MTVWEGLYKLILGPIELLFDIVFALSMSMTSSPVLSIVVLSLAINLTPFSLLDYLRRRKSQIRSDFETGKRTGRFGNEPALFYSRFPMT